VKNSTISLTKYELTDEAKKLVDMNNWFDFYKRYGNSFINQIITGGEFYALYQFKCESAEDKKELELSLSGSYGGFSSSGSFKTALDKIKTDVNLSVTYYVIGGNQNLPNPENTNEIIDYALNFPETVAPKTNAWRVYSAKTSDYDVVSNLPTDNPLNNRVVKDNMKILEDVAPIYDELLDLNQSYLKISQFIHIKHRIDEIKNDISPTVQDIADNPFERHTLDLEDYKEKINGIRSKRKKLINDSLENSHKEGEMIQTAVDGNGRKWGIKADQGIYTQAASEQIWQHIGGSLISISVDDAGIVWGTNSKHMIYYRNGLNDNFHQIAGRLKKISAAGDGRVWGINSVGTVFTLMNIADLWEPIVNIDPSLNIELSQISVDKNGVVWGKQAKTGRIYTRDGYLGNWQMVNTDW